MVQDEAVQCGGVVSCLADLLGFAAETALSPHLETRCLGTRAWRVLSVLLGSVCNLLSRQRSQLTHISVGCRVPRRRGSGLGLAVGTLR